MATVLKFPPQLRLVEPPRCEVSRAFRNREIAAIADYAACATRGLIDTARLSETDEAGFVRAQHDLEAALFHACSLNGAREHDRELMALLAKRNRLRELPR